MNMRRKIIVTVGVMQKNVNNVDANRVANGDGVIAIRIYYGSDGHTPIADIKTANHEVTTIRWVNNNERALFAPYINGYTLMYDEREKMTFKEM